MIKNKSKKRKKKVNLFETFTKLWVTILLIIAVIDLQLSYILAYMGCDQIAETLSVAVVTEIIGISATYMIRAYLDTKSEKEHELKSGKNDNIIDMPEEEEVYNDEDLS